MYSIAIIVTRHVIILEIKKKIQLIFKKIYLIFIFKKKKKIVK